MKYPEHEKMAKVKNKSQVIGEFLEWMTNENELFVCRNIGGDRQLLVTYPLNFEYLLAKYFDIDLDKIDKEKRQMLKELRKQK